MAEKRMFSKAIVLSDAFLDMPPSARCLYFALGMLADDDGFVNNPKSIMRQCGAVEDDMKILIAKNYLLTFENGVVVIKDWNVNNYIRSDRYKETIFLEEKSVLHIDKNGSYQIGTPDIPKIPETKIENNEELRKNFGIIYDYYPKKVGKTRGFKIYTEWINGRNVCGTLIKLENKQIWGAIKKYKNQIEENKTEAKYIKQFDTFMDKAILDYVEV